jgi:hypothetical protein
MRRRTGFGLAGLIATLALTACGPGRISIVVELEDEDGGDARLLEDIEVRLLPYDRDHVFDSLTRAASTPEPEIPAELLSARDDIAEAQRAWTEAETLEANLRDTIKKLNDKLAELNPAMNDYKAIYNRVDPMIDELEGVSGRVKSLFQTFDELQKASIEQMGEIRRVKEDWAHQAFKDVDALIDALIDASGLEEAADTTGVDGGALVEVPPGQYWVHARYKLPYDELYWNVPVTVTRGDPVVVRLSRANAIRRPIF